jgi:monoamine oxidase
MFNIGDTAKRFSTLSDEEVMDSAMSTIRKWYADVPDYVSFKRSNWGQDPYALGAWSFIKAGSSPEDCDAYFESESTGGKVFFAGEATSAYMIGTVHGAYITGVQAAKDAIDSLGEGQEE